MPDVTAPSNKYSRMARNAAMLYFRMLITMAVTLYTSRVVLQKLDVEDFGIYHLVAGFVTMLGFLHGAMSSATQRFLAFELGKADKSGMRGIFSMSMNIHIIIALVVLLIGETLGIWFLDEKLAIPPDRLDAAKWLFHIALTSFVVSILSVPYNALIIAHERMRIFAWVSIVDVALKLMVVYMLDWFSMDALVVYGFLNFAVVVIVFLIYRAYSKGQFVESRLELYWNRKLFKVMLSYTGWNLWGNLAVVMSSQGINIILNVFFGPTVNAARAIAMQVSIALNSFVQNLQIAINPQIIKSYASANKEYMQQLVCYGAKYNFFLILALALPVLNNAEELLLLWLGVLPENVVVFTQLMLIVVIIDSLSPSLMTAAQATGKIIKYQIVVGGILLLNLPFSYGLLWLGKEPQTVFYVGIGLSVLSLIARIQIISGLIEMEKKKYLIDTLLPVAMVSGFVLCANYLAQNLRYYVAENLLFESAFSVSLVIASILIFGIKSEERILISSYIKKFRREKG